TSTGTFNQTHWAFGDGTTSNVANPTHMFSANGTYVVVLTVNDSTSGSCMDYYLDTIVVTGVVAPLQCAAGFVMYSDASGVTVVNSSTGTNLTYLWDFGDGDTSNTQFPSHTYAASGSYYLCLTIDDGAGCVDMYCDSIGENGVVFNKQTGFTINVIAPPLATQVNEQVALTSDVAIYPNPTTAEFIIELASYSPKTQLSIVSVEGKMVYTNNTINTNTIVINAADWSKGIYVVKITDKQSSQVVKLVKQ
ncbi:MAG TPA: PKD domain-containing protein, partial [Vicingus sp.]|nr:PKD domain-containing protein [Vicingus sp.]